MKRGGALTSETLRPTPRQMGRKKEWTEQLRLPLAAGATVRIDAVLAPGEPRLAMIREAIEREIKRRNRAGKTQEMPK